MIQEAAGSEVQNPALAGTSIMRAGTAVAGDGDVGVYVGNGGQGGPTDTSLQPEKAC